MLRLRTLHILGAAIAATLLAAAPARAADFKVVTHPDVPASSLSSSDLKRIFLKKQTRWSDGTTVVPIDLGTDSAVRDAFSDAVHGKDTRAVDAYWQKQTFSGRDVPPATRATEGEVLDFVKRTPGAIGYVAAGTPAPGVRELPLR